MASIEDGQVSHVEFTSDEEYAAYLVDRLERNEARRTGLKLIDVRPTIARRVGIAPGTLENLRRGRIKAIKRNVYQWIVAAADRELAAEIRRLEHEREVLAAKGGRAARVDLRKVDASLAAVREALEGE